MSKTFRFKFSEEINNKLSNFGRLYSYADNEDIEDSIVVNFFLPLSIHNTWDLTENDRRVSNLSLFESINFCKLR